MSCLPIFLDTPGANPTLDSPLLSLEKPKSVYTSLDLSSSLRNVFLKIKKIFLTICLYFFNFLIRLQDPNSRSFVVESKGHFTKNYYKSTFERAVNKADNIFNEAIKNASCSKRWHKIARETQKTRKIEELWNSFSKGGTCFGNCVAMAREVCLKGRCVPLSELKEIEEKEAFIEMAQTFQLVGCFASKYNKWQLQNWSPKELPKNDDKIIEKVQSDLEFKEKIEKLGVSFEIYQNLSKEQKARLCALILIETTNEDCLNSGTTIQELLNCDISFFKKKLFDVVSNILQISTGVYLIKFLNLILSKNFEILDNIKTDTLVSHQAYLSESNGIVLLTGFNEKESTRSPHMMFLQIDRERGDYILYDNNDGFYRWNSLKETLEEAQKRLKWYKYDSCRIGFSSFSGCPLS